MRGSSDQAGYEFEFAVNPFDAFLKSLANTFQETIKNEKKCRLFQDLRLKFFNRTRQDLLTNELNIRHFSDHCRMEISKGINEHCEIIS